MEESDIEQESGMEIGTLVVKNPETWRTKPEIEQWRGDGVGLVVKPPFHLGPGHADVHWVGGRYFEEVGQLVKLRKLHKQPVASTLDAAHECDVGDRLYEPLPDGTGNAWMGDLRVSNGRLKAATGELTLVYVRKNGCPRIAVLPDDTDEWYWDDSIVADRKTGLPLTTDRGSGI